MTHSSVEGAWNTPVHCSLCSLWFMQTRDLKPSRLAICSNIRWPPVRETKGLANCSGRTVDPADCHIFFLLFSIFYSFFVILFTVVCRQKVKAVGTQGKAQQHLDLLYSHFHGSSSTRENSAVLPFLPIVTCKQLLRTSNFGAKAPAFTNHQRLGAEKPLFLGQRSSGGLNVRITNNDTNKNSP